MTCVGHRKAQGQSNSAVLELLVAALPSRYNVHSRPPYFCFLFSGLFFFEIVSHLDQYQHLSHINLSQQSRNYILGTIINSRVTMFIVQPKYCCNTTWVTFRHLFSLFFSFYLPSMRGTNNKIVEETTRTFFSLDLILLHAK